MSRRKRRWRRRWPLWLAIFAFVTYMMLIPAVHALWQGWSPARSSRLMRDDLSLSESVRLRSTEALTAFWFFALGATVGSFVNVVVYRWPRGESVVFHSSRCPRCCQPIRARDNVPVLGWFLLGGRCRTCKLPISIRYPFIEALAGTLFLWFYYIELLSGGTNLPVREPNLYAGVVWIIFYTKWDLLALYFYHLLLLSHVGVWALFASDRQAIPWWSIAGAWSATLVASCIWPDFRLVPPLSGWGEDAQTWPLSTPWLAASLSPWLGAAAGLIAAITYHWSLGAMMHRHPGVLADQAVLASTILLGLGLGWQAVLGITVLAIAFDLITLSLSIISSRLLRLPGTCNWFLAAIIHQTCWRQLAILVGYA